MVLVALGDSLLDETFKELGEAYPKVQFRKVCGRPGASGVRSGAGAPQAGAGAASRVRAL